MVNQRETSRATRSADAGYEALTEGWRQAQEFWSNAARRWGESAGQWMGQATAGGAARTSGDQGLAAIRELNEASLAVAQAWMRLPLVLIGGADTNELRDAAQHLADAQGRAFELWQEAVRGAGQTVRAAATGAARGATRSASASRAGQSRGGRTPDAGTTARAAAKGAARGARRSATASRAGQKSRSTTRRTGTRRRTTRSRRSTSSS